METTNLSPGVPDDLLTMREAAALLKVHLASVYRMVSDGRLPAWKRGGTRLFVSRAAVLGVFQPSSIPPVGQPPSHQESVDRLKRLGWL